MFYVGEKVNFDDDDDDADNDDDDDDRVQWVCCDTCDIWYHTPCALQSWPNNKPKKRGKWHCCS